MAQYVAPESMAFATNIVQFEVHIYVIHRWALNLQLVVELAVERQTDCLEKKACVLVACGIRLDGDVATRNHLRRVAEVC